MNLVKLSWKNLTYKPWATALSIILFALGIGLVSLLFLLQSQLQKNFEKNLAGIDLVVGAKGSPLQLILSSMYHVDAPTGNVSLQEIRPFLNPKHPLISDAIPLSMGDSYKSYRILGTDQALVDLYEAELAQGEIWTKNFEATIGAGVAAELGMKVGDKFASSHGFMDDADMEHDAHAFTVVGILRPTGAIIDQLILVTTQSFWLVHEHEADTSGAHATEDLHVVPAPLLQEDPAKEITSLLVKFKGRNFQALNMQRSINENTDLQAATPAIEINRLFNLMSTGEQVLRTLASVIVFVSGLSIFISLFSSLRDRKQELALMRVMGSGRKKLFVIIIIEGLLIAVIGYVLGILLSHGGMQLFAQMMQESYRYSFSGLDFLKEEGFLLIGAVVLGFIAALVPAVQASRTDISDTLTGSA